MKNYLLFVICILVFVGLFADTVVGGTIAESETWTLVNSPYIVTENLNVWGGE